MWLEFRRVLFGSFPAVPLNVSPLNVAAPVVPVVAVLLLAVAPAGLGVAVTTTLLWLTGLPLASWSCTAGCCANAWPLRAVLEGGVVSTSRVAAPAVPVAVNVTGLPASPVAVAVAVFCPAVALKVQDRNTTSLNTTHITSADAVPCPLPELAAKVTATD